MYLQASRYKQMEFGIPESIDTAAELRGRGALALYQMGYPDILFLLTDLLRDEQAVTRSAAAVILGRTQTEAAQVVLRFKVLQSDRDIEVIGNCFSALLEAGGNRSIEFVTRYLNGSDEAQAMEAALALGESRFAWSL